MTALAPFGRFPGVPAESITPEQAALIGAFMERSGAVPGPYKIWIADAPLAERLKGLSDRLLRGHLTRREREIAILVTAQRLGASYVEAAHRRLAAEAGVPEACIEAICSGKRPDLADAREALVHEAACAMHAREPTPPELFERAAAALGHEGLSELSALLGFYCSCAFILRFYDAAPAK